MPHAYQSKRFSLEVGELREWIYCDSVQMLRCYNCFVGSQMHILGKACFLKAGQAQGLRNNRSLLLCSYLISHNGWVRRETLLTLFWPDDNEISARNKLRQLLHKTKKEPYAEQLEVKEDLLRLVVTNDAQDFKEAFERDDWQQALEHYNGEFLEGIQAKNLSAYQEWLEFSRTEFSLMWREASLNWSQDLALQACFRKAAKCLQAVLEKDLLAEDVLHSYLSYAFQGGLQKEALHLFERFKRMLKQELQMEPLEETMLLVEQLKTEKQSRVSQAVTVSADVKMPKNDLPYYATQFVGRDIELLELSSLVGSQAKLITVVGAGGMGKTRLLVELARQAAKAFKHGVVYVPLAPLSSAEFLSNFLLECLQLTPYPQLKAEDQVLGYAQNHEHLFVFDNFEHLISAKKLIANLLQASPKSKIVISSRESLNLNAEHVFELKGLSVPKATESAEAYDAVQVFLKTARRVNASFKLNEHNVSDIVAICTLLEGSPLAIELAAAWSRLLKPNEIFLELERSLDFLDNDMDDLPERHRSAKAVFEHSWDLLTKQEQKLLKKLSVFQGGFNKQAAEWVADANLRTLLSLVDKSLLSREQNGRFQRHVLVQEYSKAKLAQDKPEEQTAKAKHANYYLQLTNKDPISLSYDEKAAYIDLLELEHSNLRLALDWQLNQADTQVSLVFSNQMSFFWEWQCYFYEAAQYLNQALQKAQGQPQNSIFARSLDNLAAFYYFKGELKKANDTAQSAHDLFKQNNDKEGQCDALWSLAHINYALANYRSSKNQAETSLALAKSLKDDYRKARAIAQLGGALERLDDHERSYLCLEEGLILFRKLGDLKGLADCLYKQSCLKFFVQNFEAAQKGLEECVFIAECIHYQVRLVDAKNTLGNVQREQGNYKEAQLYYQESLDLAQSIGDTVGAAFGLDNLGLIIREQGKAEEGKAYIQKSLRLRQSFNDSWGMASCLHRLAGIAAEQGYAISAATLWGVSEKLWQAIASPKPKSYQQRFERDLGFAKSQLTQREFDKTFQQGQTLALEEAVEIALASDKVQHQLA